MGIIVLVLLLPFILLAVILFRIFNFLNILGWISSELFAVKAEIEVVDAISKFADEVRDGFKSGRN